MEEISVLRKVERIRENTHESGIIERVPVKRTAYNPAVVSLISDGDINFFHYLKGLNLAKESDILVLPSNHHYYYDQKELKSVRVLVNLKKLNLIKHLDKFLENLVCILPPSTNFVGCFSDNTLEPKASTSYRFSKLYNRFINFLDDRTDHLMSKYEVTKLLERNGFRTIDMKEINGMVYFYSQKVQFSS
jgi:hypothetical protein